MKKVFICFINFIVSINVLTAQIFFSEYVEGSSYNKYIEIYNYSEDVVDLASQFVLTSCTNGCLDGNNFYINEFPDGAVVNPGDVYVVAATQADDVILTEADYTFQYCCGNGDDVYAIMLAGMTGEIFDSSNALDIIGDESTWQANVGWDVAGVEQATKNHTLIRKSSVSTHNAGDWMSSAGTNMTDSEWIVLDQDDFSNLGFHDFDGTPVEFGCLCPEAYNFTPAATVDDGSCVVDGGCSDNSALNYSGDICLSASFINENCQYEIIEISGCYGDDQACNIFDFNSQSTMSSMTLAVTDVSNLISGDLLACFYIDEQGYIKCGGSVLFNGDPLAIAAWADDPSTSNIDGFHDNDSFIFLVLRDGIVLETTSLLNTTTPFSATWINNGFGQISELSVGDEFVQNCIFPLIGYDCDGNLNPVKISEDQLSTKSLITTIDILGRKLKLGKNSQLRIMIYDDGTIEKRFYLNH